MERGPLVSGKTDFMQTPAFSFSALPHTGGPGVLQSLVQQQGGRVLARRTLGHRKCPFCLRGWAVYKLPVLVDCFFRSWRAKYCLV